MELRLRRRRPRHRGCARQARPRPQARSRLQSPADLRRRRSGAASGGLDRLGELHLRDLPQLPRAAAGDDGVLRRRRDRPPRSSEAG